VSDGFDETADAGTGNTAQVALAPGSHLGKYRVDRVLGEGGMGVVWAAHDPDLERKVAIKVLRYAQAAQPLRQRLLREARAMAKLKHPNVLTVYEVGTVGDRDYIAMELVDGMSLDQWLALAPTPDEIWSAVLAAGRGLAAAHDAGVVHRDFKPHNVLRSREGRILVTDFGLARGMLAEGESAAIDAHVQDAAITPYDKTVEATSQSDARRANDSVLDAPLTQTGALIGTPAYMAPEQYRGAPPDPRTDQFAFCVTAWQALTGERPFKGQTLDEMRTSASGGVAHIETKLPRAVRAVLARGLDPIATARWPSLDALLDELERAGERPAQRKRLFVSVAALASTAAAVAGALVLNRTGERAKTGCDEPDTQFTEAWSPAVRSALSRRTNESNVARLSEQLDRYTERWIESYAKACRGRPAKMAQPRLICLEGLRDYAAAFTTVLAEDAEPQVLDTFEPRDALTPISSCETASPVAPPRVPIDQPRRDKILRLIGRDLSLRTVPSDRIGTVVEELLAEAKPLDWEPLASLVLVAGATQYERHGKPALARATYRRAIDSLPKNAELRDLRVEGAAYLGLLGSSLSELEDPRASVPAALTDPKAKVPLHGELAVRITKATNVVGSDPFMVGARSLLAAVAYAHAAQWNRYASGYDEALRLIGEARRLFDEIGDVQRAAYASSIEASVYLLRGDDRALDDALFAARRAQDALETAKLPRLPGLDEVRATVAFARRDYAELHRIQQADSRPQPPAISAPVIKGRVVGENIGFAQVIAWKGTLVGHARNLAMDPRDVVGSIVRVERDGTFTIPAEPGWAIMAEWQDARSTPRLVGSGPLTLELKPTVTISGQLQGRNWFGVKAFARYKAGENSWTMQTPIEKDGTFDLRGLPAGARSYGTEGAAGTGERTIIAGTNPKAISWSYGQGIEVIVRTAQFGDGAQAWVLRGDHAIATRGQLDTLVATSTDVAIGRLEPIGVNNTDSGRDVYRPGDRHAVITGNYDGLTYTVCATPAAAAPVSCKPFTVDKTIGIELSDGRYGGGVTPILFEL
jgi:serine/threonine protein kinase